MLVGPDPDANAIKVHMGFLTMNAGDDIPGSTIKWTIDKYQDAFDGIVVVDGNPSEDAIAFYDQYPKVHAVHAPWKGVHLDQYIVRNDLIEDGHWLLALDCDEAPSEELMGLIKDMKNGMLPMECNMVHLPVVTYWCKNNSDWYYRVEKWPDKEGGAGYKRILYRKESHNSFITNPNCNTHVTPTFKGGEKAMRATTPYLHFKSPEAVVLNSSICIMEDIRPIGETPEQRGFTEADVVELEGIAKKYDLASGPKFREATKKHQWPRELQDFATRFAKKPGTQAICLYLLYFIVEGQFNDYLQDPDFRSYEYLCKSIGNPRYNNIYTENEKSKLVGKDKLHIYHTDVRLEDPKMPAGAG